MALLIEERYEGLADLRERAQAEVSKVVVGHERTVELMLVAASKARARLNGRAHVTISDVREMAPYVLRHRLTVKDGTTQDEALLMALESVPAPVGHLAD